MLLLAYGYIFALGIPKKKFFFISFFFQFTKQKISESFIIFIVLVNGNKLRTFLFGCGERVKFICKRDAGNRRGSEWETDLWGDLMGVR